MSIRLAITRGFMRVVVKPRLRHLTDVPKARRELERAVSVLFRAPPFTWYRETRLAGKIPALWIEVSPASRPVPADKVLLYLHGGGFVAGSPNTHRKFLARLSKLSGTKICAPDYRKAPENRFPAAVEDCLTAFEALLEQGYAPQNILLGGDSAGGGLCFSVLGALQKRGLKPAGIVTFSPIVDLRFTSASFEENRSADPLLPSERRDLVLDHYLAEGNASDPAASPILYEFKTPPPVFFQFSTTEILRDESLRMAARLKEVGGQVVLDEWPDAPHVWVIMDGRLPEAREGLRRAAGFIRQVLHGGSQGES
ncbi:alpha/beta hydrolase [Aliiroseovarius marinus]|uniref:alpha/beta hydrolase n=1 Tax=Aliiroseovarius marinus TaxID=2500159 RepID=UPI003D7DB1F2